MIKSIVIILIISIFGNKIQGLRLRTSPKDDKSSKDDPRALNFSCETTTHDNCSEAAREIGQAMKNAIQHLGTMQTQEQGSTIKLATAAEAEKKSAQARSVQTAMLNDAISKEKADAAQTDLINKLETDKLDEQDNLAIAKQIEMEKLKQIQNMQAELAKAQEDTVHVEEEELVEEQLMRNAIEKENAQHEIGYQKLMQAQQGYSDALPPQDFDTMHAAQEMEILEQAAEHADADRILAAENIATQHNTQANWQMPEAVGQGYVNKEKIDMKEKSQLNDQIKEQDELNDNENEQNDNGIKQNDSGIKQNDNGIKQNDNADSNYKETLENENNVHWDDASRPPTVKEKEINPHKSFLIKPISIPVFIKTNRM